MMNFKKNLLTITLALAVIAPTAVYATATNNITPNGSISLSEKKEQLKVNREKKLQTRIERHEKTFQKADVIVAGTLEKGMAVLNERIALRSQISDIRKEKREALVLPLKEELKAEVAAIKEQLTNGKIPKAEAKVKLQALQQEKKTEIQKIKDEFKKQYETESAALKIKRAAVSESYKSFTLAVKSKEATKIESTFKIYLENSNELNLILKGLINNITV